MRVEDDRPFINGVCFDDTYGMNEGVKRDLCYHGLLFVTTLKIDGKSYGGNLIARDFEHAKRRAEERPWGETVDGQLEAFGKLPPPEPHQ
jgi:hypothetical protein